MILAKYVESIGFRHIHQVGDHLTLRGSSASL